MKKEITKKLIPHVTDEQADRLADYLLLLEQWNKAYNLTAIRDIDDMLVKHIFDSLSVCDYIEGDSIIDVGTGGGLPGVVLAIMFPEKHFTLLDSNGKKTRFLNQTVYDLKLENVTVVHDRVENYSGQFDGVISRAFTELKGFIDCTNHLLKPQGLWFAMKGPGAEQESKSINLPFKSVKLTIPELSDARELVIVSKA